MPLKYRAPLLRNMPFLISIAALIYFSITPNRAIADANTNCIDHIDTALHDLREVDAWVETVPPEKNDYFANETYSATRMIAADKISGRHRFGKLLTQPYYHAWQFHQDLQYTAGHLEDAEKYLKIKSVEDLTFPITTISFGLGSLGNVAVDFDDYTQNASGDISPDLSEKGAYLLSGEIPAGMASAITCLAEKIAASKK